MARKKVEPITSLGDEYKLTVQKSLPLFSLWRSELTLSEFKILDTYLARINSHDPDQRTVIFEKGELEKILGVKRIRTEELDKRIEHLLHGMVKLPKVDKTGFTRITLFELADVELDENGVWSVILKCTESAMEYIFNIENLGYLRYKLRCITSLVSRYTYIMFIYIEANRFRKSWDVPLEELKQILNCDKEETYKQYKRFNDLILKKVLKEMNEKTECRYSYEPIKKGRSVVAIHFEVETLPKTIEDTFEPQRLTEPTETINVDGLIQEALEPLKLTKEQIEEINSILVTIPDSKLPQSSAAYGSKDLSRYHYIDQKIKEILRRDKQKPIKNKFSYFIKIIKKDCLTD